jgi:hypothetical protein
LYGDGKVKLSFHKHSTSSRFLDKSSTSSATNPKRIYEIPSIINMSYRTNTYKKSTSNISIISFQNADYTTNIPKPLYINNDQHFPITSPTLCFITENILNKFNVLETNFVVNKKYFIDNFYANPNSKNRSWFFKKKICNEKRKYKNIFMILLHHINTNLIL